MSNSLGSVSFIAMHPFGDPHGTPPIIGEETAMVQRPGVDGTGFILTGQRGQPFPMTTFADVTSLANAHVLMNTYRDMKGDGGGYNAPYALVKWGVNYSTTHNTAYVVLDVQTRLRPIRAASGGLVTNPTHVVIAEWTLCPVEV